MDFNKLTVTGRLTRDPKDISKEGAEKKTVALSLASNHKEKISGEWQEKVTFFEAIIFGNMAETCLKYLGKGSKVLVSGRVGYKTWEKDGKTSVVLTVAAGDVLFLETKKAEEEAPF